MRPPGKEFFLVPVGITILYERINEWELLRFQFGVLMLMNNRGDRTFPRRAENVRHVRGREWGRCIGLFPSGKVEILHLSEEFPLVLGSEVPRKVGRTKM